MKLVRCFYDDKPQELLQHEAVAARLPVDHRYDGKSGHSRLRALSLGLFPSFFSMHFSAITLFDGLKRKKNA